MQEPVAGGFTGRVAVALVLLLLSTAAPADERIHSFHSEIDVYEDGSMMVTEAIRVTAENETRERNHRLLL